MISIQIWIVLYYNNHRFYQSHLYTRLVRRGETSIYSRLFIQILVIDLDRTYANALSERSTVCRFGISIQYYIIQYITRKS